MRPRRDFRADIQALRAFAVLVVVLNHLWPLRLTGGFVGVDVFFVISGFLISKHLMKSTLDADRKLDLVEFYARRIRRLLPAAFMVLFVSAIGVLYWMPADMWRQNFTEIFTSSAYVQNLYLTARAVDYHAAGQAATVAQHYWSLSVEEQFYVVWPWWLLGLAWLAGRLRRNARQVTAIGMAAFVLGFLAFSVWYTAADFNRAYFFTPVGVWEFAAGGFVAAIAPRLSGNWIRPWIRFVSAAIGWIAIALSSYFFTIETFFPGYMAAIPVFATALVIAAGTGGSVPVLGSIARFYPVRWLGDVSYSVYLWHWPLIVLAPYMLGGTLFWREKIGIFVASLVLAGVSKPFVEEVGIRSVWFGAKMRRAFILMVAGITTFAASWVGAVYFASGIAKEEQARLQALLAQECVGPAALLEERCSDHVNDPVISEILGEDAKYWTPPPGGYMEEIGFQNDRFYGKQVYDYRENPEAPVNSNELITLVGDSHADQWKWPVAEIAKLKGMRLEVMVADGTLLFAPENQEEINAQNQACEDTCGTSSSYISEEITRTKPRVLLYSARGRYEQGQLKAISEVSSSSISVLARTWDSWITDGVGKAFVIADVPSNVENGLDPFCWSRSDTPEIDCVTPRDVATADDPLPEAFKQVRSDGVALIDFADAFCSNTLCYQVVGGLPAYYDAGHMNRQYALRLTDRLADAIELSSTKE